jgi:PadR family transcriptional regulator PadR
LKTLKKPLKLVQGSLDLLILRAVSRSPIHGYGIMAWIKTVGGEELGLEEGALYHALHRLDRKGLIQGEWEISPDTGRKAKFYSLTPEGVEQLAEETAQWEGYIRLLQQVMASD